MLTGGPPPSPPSFLRRDRGPRRPPYRLPCLGGGGEQRSQVDAGVLAGPCGEHESWPVYPSGAPGPDRRKRSAVVRVEASARPQLPDLGNLGDAVAQGAVDDWSTDAHSCVFGADSVSSAPVSARWRTRRRRVSPCRPTQRGWSCSCWTRRSWPLVGEVAPLAYTFLDVGECNLSPSNLALNHKCRGANGEPAVARTATGSAVSGDGEVDDDRSSGFVRLALSEVSAVDVLDVAWKIG